MTASTERSGVSDADAPQAEPSGDALLVVDDDPGVRRVVTRLLGRTGYRVFAAADGDEALRVAAEQEGRFALLLTDLVMPGMSGRELGEVFSARYPDVPVLYMSAYTEDEAILRGLRLSEIDFLAKPFGVDGLRAKVAQVLGRSVRDD